MIQQRQQRFTPSHFGIISTSHMGLSLVISSQYPAWYPRLTNFFCLTNIYKSIHTLTTECRYFSIHHSRYLKIHSTFFGFLTVCHITLIELFYYSYGFYISESSQHLLIHSAWLILTPHLFVTSFLLDLVLFYCRHSWDNLY